MSSTFSSTLVTSDTSDENHILTCSWGSRVEKIDKLCFLEMIFTQKPLVGPDFHLSKEIALISYIFSSVSVFFPALHETGKGQQTGMPLYLF
ncbi:hypothetical protein GOODEAATRI_009502, partial [Goodea atripinnis]